MPELYLPRISPRCLFRASRPPSTYNREPGCFFPNFLFLVPGICTFLLFRVSFRSLIGNFFHVDVFLVTSDIGRVRALLRRVCHILRVALR